MKRELGIARCGLACCLCSENVTCKGCRRDGFLELSWCKDAEFCEVRRCGIDRNLNGCYECEPAKCRREMKSPSGEMPEGPVCRKDQTAGVCGICPQVWD